MAGEEGAEPRPPRGDRREGERLKRQDISGEWRMVGRLFAALLLVVAFMAVTEVLFR